MTLSGIEPGAPLGAATVLADELDARRVPLTLLVGPRPHPEVAAWAAARRRAGDAVLLHGVGEPARGRRLPEHEAGLRLAGAVRVRDALGLPVDGYAGPGWDTPAATRRALGAVALAELAVLVDADGVHRLATDGTPAGSCAGPVRSPDAPVARPLPERLRSVRRRARAGAAELVHVTGTASPARPALPGLLAEVDAALDAGALPGVPAALVPSRRSARRGAGRDPELWSITA